MSQASLGNKGDLSDNLAGDGTIHPSLSIFLPVYNEEGNLEQLNSRIIDAIEPLALTFEIIYVDDGSADSSYQVLSKIAAADSRVRVISFRRNYGQTAAMAAGIRASRGQILIPMDADLQNDPNDISRLLTKLDEGYDVVSGWRVNRKDRTLTRTIPSRIANWLISHIGGVKLHDYGCSLKAYRRDVLKGVNLYGEMHRFIPIYASWMGGKVAEIPVTHHARTYGRSNYGISRTINVIFDLITIKFMADYLTKPLYMFGTAGLITFAVSGFAGLFALSMKYLDWPRHSDLIQTPLPVVALVLFALGIQFFLMGLLAEISVRTYHESQSKPVYTIRRTINFAENEELELGL